MYNIVVACWHSWPMFDVGSSLLPCCTHAMAGNTPVPPFSPPTVCEQKQRSKRQIMELWNPNVCYKLVQKCTEQNRLQVMPGWYLSPIPKRIIVPSPKLRSLFQSVSPGATSWEWMGRVQYDYRSANRWTWQSILWQVTLPVNWNGHQGSKWSKLSPDTILYAIPNSHRWFGDCLPFLQIVPWYARASRFSTGTSMPSLGKGQSSASAWAHDFELFSI